MTSTMNGTVEETVRKIVRADLAEFYKKEFEVFVQQAEAILDDQRYLQIYIVFDGTAKDLWIPGWTIGLIGRIRDKLVRSEHHGVPGSFAGRKIGVARSPTNNSMSERARAQLDLARGILGLTRGRPRQIVLKRAISNAYYALFHCLAAAGRQDEEDRVAVSRALSSPAPARRSGGRHRARRRTLLVEQGAHRTLRTILVEGQSSTPSWPCPLVSF